MRRRVLFFNEKKVLRKSNVTRLDILSKKDEGSTTYILKQELIKEPNRVTRPP